MIDRSDRIVRINEALSLLFEKERKSFQQLRTERMAERVKQNELRGQLRAQADARKTAENDKFIKRWNSDDEIKRLGLDTNKLPTDNLARARAIRKASWQSVQDTLARQPKFEDTPLGKQAAAERKRIAQREIGDAVPEGTSPEDMEALYYGEIKTQMASARQYDAMTPGQKQAERDRQAQARIANWEANQKRKMEDRISKTWTGKEYVAAARQAEKSQEEHEKLLTSLWQTRQEQIRASKVGIEQRQAEIMKNLTPEELERPYREAEEKLGIEKVPGLPSDVAGPPSPSDFVYRRKKSPTSPEQPSQTAPEQPSQGKFEFYNRNTGQIEKSNAPGVDRVFRDSSGKAYRIEGGSGRKIYV